MIAGENRVAGVEEERIQEVFTGDDPVQYLRDAIASGEHWYISLLKAIALWRPVEDDHNGRYYRYLIEREAFDWLLLAERLCEAVDGAVPQEEKEALLFLGKAPLELSEEQFKELMGPAKYRAHLNYFYGVTVEEALLLAVEEEVRREGMGLCCGEEAVEDEVYQRLYGATRDELLEKFRDERRYPQTPGDIDFEELKEFTYWLFKLRFQISDKSRFASDIKKGLQELGRQWGKSIRHRARQALIH